MNFKNVYFAKVVIDHIDGYGRFPGVKYEWEGYVIATNEECAKERAFRIIKMLHQSDMLGGKPALEYSYRYSRNVELVLKDVIY